MTVKRRRIRKPPQPPVDPTAEQAEFLADCAQQIHTLGKAVVRDIIEIGRILTEAKERVGHGNWLPWLKAELGWSPPTATNLMHLYQAFTAGKLNNFCNLDIVNRSSLYLLAATDTPIEAIEEVAEQTKTRKVDHAEVKAIVEKHRGPKRRRKGAQSARTEGVVRAIEPVAEPQGSEEPSPATNLVAFPGTLAERPVIDVEPEPVYDPRVVAEEWGALHAAVDALLSLGVNPADIVMVISQRLSPVAC
jgi:hypothetical protein